MAKRKKSLVDRLYKKGALKAPKLKLPTVNKQAKMPRKKLRGFNKKVKI